MPPKHEYVPGLRSPTAKLAERLAQGYLCAVPPVSDILTWEVTP